MCVWVCVYMYTFMPGWNTRYWRIIAQHERLRYTFLFVYRQHGIIVWVFWAIMTTTSTHILQKTTFQKGHWWKGRRSSTVTWIMFFLWRCSSVSISFDKSPSASGCTSPMSPRSPTAPREHRPSPCQTPSPGRPQSPDHSGHMGEVLQHWILFYHMSICALLALVEFCCK